MAEHRAATKGRRLGSSRRKQLREGSGEAPGPAPSASEEPPWASEIVQRAQQLLSDRDTEQAGVVTRSDMQKLQEEGLPCSREELELVFDGLDAAGTGRLGTEEFTAGLRQFLSSQKAAREHRRRKTASRRVRLVLPAPAGGDSEERRHFAAFMEQLGTASLSEEQEIWQLWVKLRQDEPQLLDNLEDFLAKMRHRIQEARSEKEALELTLNKRVAEHDKDVQQLCEVLEQQIQQEQLRLQQQSMARSHQQGEELQRVLEASEREVQRLVTAQMELERRCRSLQSSQQVTSMENQQLEESNRALQQHLQHLHQQLQQTQGRLRTMRATVVWEHTGDRAVAELPIEVPMSPIEVPMSPQLSPDKSEKFRSEMRIRLGSQSSESKAKSTHQVVWEMLPAEINLSGAPRKASSAEEDPFPESLKEEGVSDQSSLLREMNDAIAALSKHLKEQGAPPALADTPCHPWDNAEPQTGPEAATAHETTPGVLQETLPGHVHHELLEGDLQKGAATAELRAPDVTQAGASRGAGHCRAQEPGAEQGDSPEEAHRMLFLPGKGAGVEEMVLNVAEHLGESMEAGEQVLREVQGAGWLQEKTAWAKPQLLGEAEEVEISQREKLEAGLGPPEAGQEGSAVAQCLARDEQQAGRTLGESVQSPGTALQEWAEPASGLPGELETELGEHLEPEPPSWGEARVEAAHGGGVPEVTVAPGPGVLDEERARTEVQPWGETMDSKVLEVLPAQAEHAGSTRAGSEEEEVEEAEPREAEQQLQGECSRGGAGWRGSTGALEPLAEAVPPTHGQGGGGTELMGVQSSTNMELLAEMEADLQVWNEAGSPGTQQGGDLDPGVQLEKDKPEAGLGEEMGAAAVHSEGPSPGGIPEGSPDLCGLFPVKSEALELVEADLQQCGGLSSETPQGGEGERALQLQEHEEEEGAQGQGEHELPHEPVPHSSGATLDQGEGAGAALQPGEEAEGLDTLEDQSSGAHVQLIAEGDELRLAPGGSTEAELQPLAEAGSSGTEQGGSVDSERQPMDQGDQAEFLEVEAEEHTQLPQGLSSGVPRGGEIGTNVQIEEKDDGAQGQGKGELPQEPVLDLQGSGVRQGEGAGEDVQAQAEAEGLDTAEEQSSGAHVQLMAEGGELRLAPEGSTEAELQPLAEAGSSGTEQGGSVDSDVQPLDQGDQEEFLEREAENGQEDMMSHEGLGPGAPWGWEGERAVQLEEEDGAQGQGEHGLLHEPVLHLQGSGVGYGAGADEDVQAQVEAESLDTLEDQSSGANVQLIAEGDELKSASAESTKADLQPLSQTDSMGTEQGGNVAPDVHPLHLGDKKGLVEMEAEGSWIDTQLCVTASPETPQGGGHCAAEQPRDGAGDWGQGQGGCGLMQELVPHSSEVTIRQRGGTDAGVQPVEKVVILDTAEEQSSGAHVQLIAEGDELRLAPGGSTEAELQPLAEAGSSGTEQGGSVDSEVQPMDQGDQAEFLEVEAEEHTQLSEGLSSGVPWGGEIGANVQIEEKDDGAQGQGKGELPQEPVLDLQGSGVRQGEGAGEDVQAQAEAEGLDTAEEQSSGANVQLMAEGGELRLAPGGSTEAELQPLAEAGSSGTEQGGSVDSERQSLDQGDKAELVGVDAQDAQADLQLCGGLSPGAPWGGEWGRAIQNEEDEEDGAQLQGENGLPQESVLGPEGTQGQQGEGAGAGVQPQEEAESLDTLEVQSTDADVQLFTDQQKPKSGSGGSTEADLTHLGVAGMWEGQQSLTVGLEAVLGASPTANPWEGAAVADVPTPAEAALCPEPVTAAEGPGLEAKLGACLGPEGQILEAQELLQGDRAPPEGKPLDGTHGLEVAQGERLEAGARNGVKTQGLGLKQGHDDAALAPLVSEVPLQISPQKLEMMMQEHVLIPDVWRLCAPGQAAQRELQEQVSAQGHEGRPEGETPPTMEPEHTAAGPAEHPKQEMPPASTLHSTAEPEDHQRDQLGVVLRDNSLGQRQLLGEQSKDLGVGQREKMQEFGQKMSQEGRPSPGEPGAVTAGGERAAPRGCPKAPLDPDHLYNVLFVGDSHVGKTSFLYRLHADTFNPHLAATVGLDYQIKTLVVDNKCFALRLWDSAGQERYRSVTKQFFRKADGVVLMYDITSEYSFSDVRYWLSCIQEAAEDGVAVLLLGNKTDCAAQRQVPTKEGECLAREHQLMFYECSAASGHNVFESMVSFIRLLKGREDELKNKAEELPKAPQKKKSCCW